jgi:multidrug resistance protein
VKNGSSGKPNESGKGQTPIGLKTLVSEFRMMLKYRDLTVLNFAILVSMIGFGLIMPFIPIYADDFGATDFEIGLMVGLFAVVRLIFSPIGGWTADRFGRKPSMVFAMFLYSVNMAMFGFANSLYELFLYRALQGAASGLMWPVAMTYIGDVVEEEDRGKAMAMYSLMFATGTAVGPLLGGTIATYSSLSMAFFVTAAMALISALMLVFWVKESHEINRKDRKRIGIREALEQFRLRNVTNQPGTFMGISVGSFTAFFGMAVLYPMLPIYGREAMDLTDFDIGLLFTLIGTIQVVFMFPAGVFGDRMGKKRLMIIGSAIAALFSAFIPLSPTFGVLVGVIIIYTFGRSIARPLFPAIISSLTEKENRGKGMGIYTLAQNLAFALGSTFGGFVSGMWGREYPFFMAAVVGLLGLVIMIMFVDEDITRPRIDVETVEEVKAIEETDGCME